VTSSSRLCLVLGAGGHAKTVIEAAQLARDLTICGLIAPDGEAIGGVPVLGSDGMLAEIAKARGIGFAVPAIGDNIRRRDSGLSAAAAGLELAGVRHPAAVFSASASIDDGVVVLAGAVVNAAARVGKGTILNTASIVEHDARIGDWAHVAPGAVVLGAASVGDGAFVGARAVVLPGIIVGAGATVGAGAVVNRNVPDGATVAGVPARAIAARTG
jgi:UDP-perosamine 4-acetyltransferase